jgi:cytochrome c-type biogenesis protein CcmH
MKDVIAEKLAAGTDTQEIKNYFVAQYGPQVLGEPPMEGFNWFAWLLPVAVVIGGAVFIWSRARRMVRSSHTDDVAATAAAKAAPPTDEYAEKLDKELKQYD